MLIAVFYFIGASNSSDSSQDSRGKITIDVVGSSQIKTINNPSKIVSIELVGSSNQISVTKETEIDYIEIVGSSNVFNFCKTHSPEIEDTGSSNVLNYLDC